MITHPFRDRYDRPTWHGGITVTTLLNAWRQVESQGRTPVRWLISRRLARRLAREEYGELSPVGPYRLFDMPAALTDDADGFGIVVR